MRFSSAPRSVVLFPAGDGLRGVFADAADLEQLRSGRAQDGRRIAEVFEQLPHADRADVLDQVQRHQSFARLHACGIAGSKAECKGKSAMRTWQSYKVTSLNESHGANPQQTLVPRHLV